MTIFIRANALARALFLLVVCGGLIGGSLVQAELIGHWALDDGLNDPDATTAIDSSPNGYDGELINFFGSPWVTEPDAKYGSAIDFELEEAAVEIDLGDALPVGNDPRTLAAWVNVAVMKDGKFLSYGEGADGAAFDFTVEEHDGTPHVWFRHWGGNIRFPGAEELELFHFAAVVPEDAEWTSDLQVYINGEESIGVRGAGEDRILDTGLSSLFIGARHPDGAPNPFDGIVDDVWLFDEPLGESEIQAIMNGTVGTVPLQPGDADQDLDFDQLDLVRVQIAAKYLTGQPATWGEGDWNAAPGGEQGSPPLGDGSFNQLDIIAALAEGKYLTGKYGATVSGAGSSDHVNLVDIPVPEPTSLVLLGLGLTVTLLARARRRGGGRSCSPNVT